MKNNKGFTLIEILAVVAVLIIVLAIITPKIFTEFKHAENITDQEQINSLINTAKIYMNQNTNLLPGENNIYAISLDELKESGLIQTKEILKPSTKQELTGCVLVQYETNKYKYTYNENKIICQFANQLVTSGDGLYTSQGEPGRLIYRGSNPDNYIWLDENGDITKTDDEMYRIISYEPDGTIKVLKNTSLGLKRWDENNSRNSPIDTYCKLPSHGCNVWGNQSNTYYNGETLEKLGQDFYYKYYPTNSSTTLEDTADKGKVTKDAALNTYLNETWINTLSFKDIIVEHSFNVGGVFLDATYNEKSLIKIKDEERTYIWKGKIALKTLSEYQEASTNSTCTLWANTSYAGVNYSYGEWPCALENWQFHNAVDWILTALPINSYENWYVRMPGDFDKDNYLTDGHNVFPAFYLKSSVVLTGQGSETSPYTITSY